MPESSQIVLEARNVVQHYRVSGRRRVRAVDGISLGLRRGETLAVVGESGCGKSTLARLLMCLEQPLSGEVRLDGASVTGVSPGALRQRRRLIQMVFQDPYASLDPRMSASEIVREPLDNYRLGSQAERRDAVVALLNRVGLGAGYAGRFPHELSGGQRQRLGIARALALKPLVLVADEPVSALDVSIQAQIINLLADLQAEEHLSILFVSHDIGAVSYLSDRVIIMYLGRIVEEGPTDAVLNGPLHPYSRALLEAVPAGHPRLRRGRPAVTGEPPSPVNPPSGCRFHPRCPLAVERCRTETPLLREVARDRRAACHLVT